MACKVVSPACGTHMWYTGEANLGTPFLSKRRAGWYIRVRTPADLRLCFGDHVVRTLHTSDLAVARRRAVHVAAGLGSVWHELRQSVVKLLGHDIAALSIGDLIRCDRKRLLADFEKLGDDDRRRLRERLADLMSELTQCLAEGRENDGTYRIMVDGMEHARMVGRLEGMREAIDGAVAATASAVTAAMAAGPREAPIEELAEGAKLVLSQHLDAFFVHQGVSAKTEAEYRVTYRKLVTAIGDVPIGSITENKLIEFFNDIPNNVKARGGRTMAAAATQQKHATALKALFNWAAGRKLCPDDIASRLKATKSAKKEERKFGKRPFDKHELERFFHLPLFTGAQSEHFINKSGKVIIRDHRFFFSLVALMTGGRLNELAQALLSDVKAYDGTPYLFITTDISEDDDLPNLEQADLKRLKTANAKRCIPIHPILRKLGFMEYIETRRRIKPEDGLLFPDAGYGQLYNQRLLIQADAKSVNTSFHSFRHCYKDMLRSFVGNEELQNRLMGHAPKGAGGNYGSPLTGAEVKAFNALEPAVSLSHLFSRATDDV